MNINLIGKNALVCGSSKGIGKASAIALSALGPEGFVRGEGLRDQCREFAGEAGLGLFNPSSILCNGGLDLRLGGSFWRTDDKPPVRFDLKAEGFAV